MTTIAIGGSRALPSGIPGRLLIRFLAGLPEGSKLLLRSGASTGPGDFETQTAMIAALLGLEIEYRVPEPIERPATSKHRTPSIVFGRQAVYDRDVKMVLDADLTLCFWLEDQTGDETSGTVAMCDKAVQYDRDVYAYAVTPDGRVERVGEWDPQDRWSALVPQS